MQPGAVYLTFAKWYKLFCYFQSKKILASYCDNGNVIGIGVQAVSGLKNGFILATVNSHFKLWIYTGNWIYAFNYDWNIVTMNSHFKLKIHTLSREFTFEIISLYLQTPTCTFTSMYLHLGVNCMLHVAHNFKFTLDTVHFYPRVHICSCGCTFAMTKLLTLLIKNSLLTLWIYTKRLQLTHNWVCIYT